jgi:(4S)-4-hydroxy-5-phosphonooxypentane-2,3-dione isomerase
MTKQLGVNEMFVMHINIKVKNEFVEEFKQVCIENAKNSVKEKGIRRFDVLQQSDEPTRFLLVEAYDDESGIEAHRKTAHYNKWRTEAERMVEGERVRTKFMPVWPEKY